MASIVYGLKETGKAFLERNEWIMGAHVGAAGLGYLVGGTRSASLAMKIATVCSAIICGIEHPQDTPKPQHPLGRRIGNFLPLAVVWLAVYLDMRQAHSG